MQDLKNERAKQSINKKPKTSNNFFVKKKKKTKVKIKTALKLLLARRRVGCVIVDDYLENNSHSVEIVSRNRLLIFTSLSAD